MTILHWAYQVERIVKKKWVESWKGMTTFFFWPCDSMMLVNDKYYQLISTDSYPQVLYIWISSYSTLHACEGYLNDH